MGSSSSANLWVLLGLGLAGILIMTRKLKKVVKEDFGAFVERFQLLPPPQPAPPKAPHPLTGLSFSVSDLFDIDGFVTGFGNPDWARTHEAASQTSPVLSALIEGGATCIGKTVVDEMAYSISGENKHYGTPTNPAAPARIPGGSSSGGAVAVAANLVDFSLGIDTDGGVRVPAGYCGVIGFRPSHGALSHVGIIPVSSSFDTVGWFAKDPNILRRVGHVLLQVPFAVQRNPRNIIIADDYFQMLKISADQVTQVVIKSTEKLFGRQVLRHENLGDYFDAKVPSLKAFYGKKSNGEVKSSSIRSLANAMQLIKRYEFKHNHEEWISSAKPILDPVIRAQIHESLEIEDKEIESCHTIRNEMRMALNSLLKDDGILVIPTNADPPPKLGHRETLSEDRLSRAFSLLSLASMSGCCQVSVPLGFYDKCPVSVSLVARHGGDRFLLDTVQTMYASLQEQADIISKSKLSTNAISRETSAEIAKEKGNQAFKDKQYQKAISSYTEAIKLSGNNATYYSNRAAAHLEIGSFLQAEADCTKAINLDKKNVKAYLRRGTAREMLGYYKEAIEDFSYALVLEPTNKRAAVSAERLRKLFL
ncbi:Translocon at the outer membrane of chloroplasts 64 [Camellia lanceoleosa]|uniref:Translocon at the outer membrane of chloroplasts 64 n=1 Tax=Camellia lanceoleosa TaxID=1840588 RepID=A0ACC0I2C8_9ERIC|nr:Translocon at the outer membrane of chloroplasts 64 [Camellia lanceoleosa]